MTSTQTPPTTRSTTWSRVRHAGWLQAKFDLRLNFLTPSFLAVLSGPVMLIAILWSVFRDGSFDDGLIVSGAFGMAGCLGAIGMLGGFQVQSEMYTERTDGTLVRLRTLPNGVRAWLLGKTISAGVLTLFNAIVILIGGVILFPQLRPSTPLRAVALIGVVSLSYFVFLPVGVIVGTWVRSTWGLIFSMGVTYLAFGGSGTVVPIVSYPTPLQWIIAATPMYWSAHVARWALLPSDVGAIEFTGAFHPVLGIAILLAWGILGYLLAPRILNRGIHRETVGALTAARDRIAAQGYA